MALLAILQSRKMCSHVGYAFVLACAEVVPARLRTFIYAFDRSFEMAVAACAAPVVAKLAESYFGFDVSPASTVLPAEKPSVCTRLLGCCHVPINCTAGNPHFMFHVYRS